MFGRYYLDFVVYMVRFVIVGFLWYGDGFQWLKIFVMLFVDDCFDNGVLGNGNGLVFNFLVLFVLQLVIGFYCWFLIIVL